MYTVKSEEAAKIMLELGELAPQAKSKMSFDSD